MQNGNLAPGDLKRRPLHPPYGRSVAVGPRPGYPPSLSLPFCDAWPDANNRIKIPPPPSNEIISIGETTKYEVPCQKKVVLNISAEDYIRFGEVVDLAKQHDGRRRPPRSCGPRRRRPPPLPFLPRSITRPA